MVQGLRNGSDCGSLHEARRSRMQVCAVLLAHRMLVRAVLLAHMLLVRGVLFANFAAAVC